ncbi:ABC-2 type transport system ATP-binding protein [Roseimicrobium gellanilyticum]|uniref:ABC-2 type transport system ATP-binding protein n=1 Tax=Roseimicrobium gellanilyticum TaxID=748857 RepID=A0A366H3K6_9BACT|nr:ATP-binding cassette domain-containing protein [Roseimicrobium gellanilyticum]RBP35854.1 ABC-2 type transport system ATP-binding protein [Roseimicrobium gellanilyticum]
MIQVKDLRKEFGTKVAVDGVTFNVEKGEVLGFLGPNGAGKSTSMRMVTGYYLPTAGSIRVGGIDMLEEPEKAKRLIGYLPENAPLYSDMSVSGFLGFCAEMRGLYGYARARAVDKALETCFLEPVRNQSVDTLSKGFRHRTCLAQSIIHDPEVLILDEPTDGLDPNQKHEVRNLIKRMGETKAIIFSTHILEEVESACSRAIIIDRGKIVADGTPDQLKRRAPGADAVRVVILGASGAAIREELGKISGVDKVESTAAEDGRFAGRVLPSRQGNHEGLSREIASLAQAKAWKVEELHREEGRLDEMFRALTRSDTA